MQESWLVLVETRNDDLIEPLKIFENLLIKYQMKQTTKLVATEYF